MKKWSLFFFVWIAMIACQQVEVNNENKWIPISAITGNALGSKQWQACDIAWNTEGTSWKSDQIAAVSSAIEEFNKAELYLHFQRNNSPFLKITFVPSNQLGKTTTDGLWTFSKPELAEIEGNPQKGYAILLNAEHPWTPSLLKAVMMNQLGEILGLPVSTEPTSVMYPLVNLSTPIAQLNIEDINLLKKLYPADGRPIVKTGEPYLESKVHVMEVSVTSLNNIPPTINLGLCWSTTTSSPTLDNMEGRIALGTSDLKKIKVSLWEFKNNTRYYLRAYASNTCGVSYGEVVGLLKP